MNIEGESINIENINQYSLKPLIRFLLYKDDQKKINNFDLKFELIKYLKIQHFSEYYFIIFI